VFDLRLWLGYGRFGHFLSAAGCIPNGAERLVVAPLHLQLRVSGEPARGCLNLALRLLSGTGDAI
jgi:hypothetical protein